MSLSCSPRFIFRKCLNCWVSCISYLEGIRVLKMEGVTQIKISHDKLNLKSFINKRPGKLLYYPHIYQWGVSVRHSIFRKFFESSTFRFPINSYHFYALFFPFLLFFPKNCYWKSRVLYAHESFLDFEISSFFKRPFHLKSYHEFKISALYPPFLIFFFHTDLSEIPNH